MFARFLNARLAAAEKALRQGRVDDAYAAARQADLCQQARGQRLLDELVRPLIARARLHRQAGRYVEALADLDRLGAIGRAGPDVQALRQQIADEARSSAQRDAEQREVAGRAAEHLAAGRLETVRLNIERVDDTRQREGLAEELDVRVRRGGQLLEQASSALDRDDVLAAVGFWQDACRRHGRSRETDEFGLRLAADCGRAVETWVSEGRLDLVRAASPALAALASLTPALETAERAAALCERAGQQLAAVDYSGLRQTLLRLKAAGGKAGWLDGALESLTRIAADHEALLAGPLGMVLSMTGRPTSPVARGADNAADVLGERSALDAGADPAAARLERPLLILVDGGGSGLLVNKDLVRLGRGGAAEVDVPIPGDVHSHHADIVRRGDDYFLTAYGPVEVNQRRVEHAMLRDGDRIALGPRTKLVFCKPCSKSESAVLRLSHRCRLPQDVGDVILFRQTCLIGRGTNCHVRTREGDGQVVLFERGGGLHVRQTAGSRWESAPVQAAVAGQTLEFGDLRLTVKPYTFRAAEDVV